MKFGSIRIFVICFIIIFGQSISSYGADKIETVPLINLEELSATFEEDKDELEKIEEDDLTSNKNEKISDSPKISKQEKVYINIKALDKITAKTSAFRLAVGEKKFFGPLEIKALKCNLSEGAYISDTIAYIQVKDLSSKDNNRVFLFNGWTFASSPTLQSIDHPVYDLWVTSCENI